MPPGCSPFRLCRFPPGIHSSGPHGRRRSLPGGYSVPTSLAGHVPPPPTNFSLLSEQVNTFLFHHYLKPFLRHEFSPPSLFCPSPFFSVNFPPGHLKHLAALLFLSQCFVGMFCPSHRARPPPHAASNFRPFDRKFFFSISQLKLHSSPDRRNCGAFANFKPFATQGRVLPPFTKVILYRRFDFSTRKSPPPFSFAGWHPLVPPLWTVFVFDVTFPFSTDFHKQMSNTLYEKHTFLPRRSRLVFLSSLNRGFFLSSRDRSFCWTQSTLFRAPHESLA